MRYCVCFFVFFCLFSQIVSFSMVSNLSDYNSYPKITKLELSVFKQSYENEDIEKRLARLEQKAFHQTFDGADLSWRTENLINNSNQTTFYNISSKQLAQIEKKVFGKTYPKDSVEKRISRLETNLFGAKQSGQAEDRFQNILKASANFNDTNISSSQTTTQSPTFTDTVKNFFGTSGYMTGYTPPISPYGYNTPYGFNNFNNSQYNRVPHHRLPPPPPRNNNLYNRYGYGQFNRTTGTGCGVHIID